MGDHLHEAGEFMLSFRFMHMAMDGNRDGTESLGRPDVLARFPVAPLKMPMDMYMAGIMYAPSSRVTLMGMLPVTSIAMDHVTRMGAEFTTAADGVGDVKVGAMVGLAEPGRQRVHVNAFVSLPTGSINRRGDTPAASDVRLPYPMQLGSGTVDLLPGITYLGQSDDWSWGLQGAGVVRLGENDNDYRLGHRLHLTGWWSRMVSDSASVSLRLESQRWGDIHGADPTLNPNMVPTANPALRAGSRVDALVGLNLYARGGALSGHRLALEFGVPLYQNLDGPQLEQNWSVTVGWQKAFAPR